MELRIMRTDDFDQVITIDAKAFGKFFNLDSSEIHLNNRNYSNLNTALIENQHQGNFVAIDTNNKIVGFIFTHVWGELGWIGTFAVEPDIQKFGYGKKLLLKAIEYLEEKNCTTIALETMPNSSYNLGFYIKYGFKPEFLTLICKYDLTKQTDQNKLKVDVIDRTNINNSIDMLKSLIKSISSSIWLGLDYTNFILANIETEECELIVIKDIEVTGFALIRKKSKNRRILKENAFIELFVVREKSSNLLSDSLASLEQYLFEKGKLSLTIYVNTINYSMAEFLIKRGYIVERTRIRMYLKKTDNPLKTIEFCSYAM